MICHRVSVETMTSSWLTTKTADLAARAAVATLFLWLAYRIGVDVLETGRLSLLPYLFNELLVVVLTVTRRYAVHVDRSSMARVATIVATFGPLVAQPDARYVVFAESAVLPLSVLGVAIVVAAKLSLGRSFGLLPANRGIVSSGVYRVVRHPIYLGYLFTHLSFLMANASPWNALVLVLADFALFIRVGAEERVLSVDQGYRKYCALVRWRVVPGIY